MILSFSAELLWFFNLFYINLNVVNIHVHNNKKFRFFSLASMHARATLKCQKIIKEMLQNKLSLHLNAHENFMIIYDNKIILTSLATFLLLMF